MFFYIGLCLNIIGAVYVTYRTLKTNNIVSPQMIVFFGICVYLYLPAVFLKSENIGDDNYNLVLLVGVIGALIACNLFPYNIVKSHTYECRQPIIKYFQIASFLYVSILIFQILQVIMNTGGVFNAFRINRLDAFLNGDMISESSIMEVFKEGLKILFYFYFAYLVENGKKIKAILMFSVPMIHHRFTAVTRFDFIAMGASLVVFFINRRLTDKNKAEKGKKQGISFVKLFVFGFVGLYVAVLFMRISNFTRYGESANGLNVSFVSLLKNTLLNDSLYYEFFHTLYEAVQNGKANYELGLSWFVYPLVNIVPRFLWPGKPYTAFSARMTDKLYWSLTSGNPVVTFSIFGEGYVQLGILGVFLCSYLFLGSRWINFRMLKQIKYNEMYMLILLFSLVTYMRSEAPIFYMLIDALWLWGIKTVFTRRYKADSLSK